MELGVSLSLFAVIEKHTLAAATKGHTDYPPDRVQTHEGQ
jgi:hypothetical protein